ncbi:MAG TPA: DUF4058 family protein [Tepidisphaeraceae bacterium]|nr:DUF4058 family protein [Tepidisphaeraceae bacterium]
MPVHDWTRVEAGIFHDFHLAWIAALRRNLNGGILPEGYYALAEQHAGRSIPDVLTLHAGAPIDAGTTASSSASGGGTAVADAPPRVRRHQTLQESVAARRRSLAVRHVTGHRLIALIELLSPANKDRRGSVEDFAGKVVDALRAGVHVLVVDVFPPGANDPRGMHEVIRSYLEETGEPYDMPADEPVTLASYVSGPPKEVYLEHLAIGAAFPDMPLFLTAERYVNVPLEPTYQDAYSGTPRFWRDVLEGRRRATHD